jgi:hypothetical protein
MKITKNNKYKIFFLLAFVAIVSSINSDINLITNFNVNNLSIINLTNFIRTLSPIILSLILTLCIIFSKDNDQFNKDYKKVFYFIFGYLLLQFISIFFYILNFDKKINLDEIKRVYILFQSLSFFLLIYLVLLKKNSFFIKNFIYILLVILSVYISYVLYQIYKEDQISLTLYWNNFLQHGEILNQIVPRVSGLARTLSVIFFYLLIILLNKKLKISNSVIIFFILSMIAFIVILTQTRTVFIIDAILLLSIFYIFKVLNKNILKIFIIIILLSLSVFVTTKIYFKIKSTANTEDFNTTKNYLRLQDEEKKKLSAIDLQNLTKEQQFFKKCHNENISINNLLTGRYCHWIYIFSKINFSILGYGPQADRVFIKWGVSNGLIYSYICAGIFGIIFYFYFIFSSLKTIKNLIIKKKTLIKDNNLAIYSILIFFCMCLRSITENSFTMFGIDQILFFITFFYIKNINQPR